MRGEALSTIRTAAAVVLLAVGAVACGGDDPSVEEQMADQAGYCAASAALGEQAAAAGLALPVAEGTEVPAAAVQAVLDGMGPRLDDMADQAPEDVRDDAEAVVEALRDARTRPSALGTGPFRQAWERLAAHRAQVCEAGGSSQGDG